MKSTIYFYLILFVLAVNSCKSDIDTLGKELVNPSTRLVYLDTFSIEMSTIIMDSIITSGKNVLLAGVYDDPFTGKIISKSYFQIGLPEDLTIRKNEIYDSALLFLTYNRYYLGDTTLNQYFEIHKLTDDLNPGDQNYFYSTTNINYENTTVGGIHFLPRPGSGDVLKITMDSQLGNKIFNYLKENMSNEITDDDFTELLQGLVLVPEIKDGNAIIGFAGADTSLFLKLYTHRTDAEETHNVIVLPFINSKVQFNQITCDWNNKPVFKNHRQQDDIHSSLTEEMTYVNAGLGIFTKITFPSLPLILEFENCILLKADLYFEPVKGSYTILPAPEKLRIYETSKKNTLDAVLLDANNNELIATLNVDKFYDEETYYFFDITEYLNDEISNHYLDPEKALSVCFSSSDISLSVDQVLFEGSEKKLTKPRLELLFMFYDQE